MTASYIHDDNSNPSRTFADPPIGAYLVDGEAPANYLHNVNPLPYPIRGFEVTTAGNVKVKCRDGSVITFPARAAGSRTSCCITQIFASGTTATGIIGLK